MVTKGYILHKLCNECNKLIKTSSMTLMATIEGNHIKPICDDCYNGEKSDSFKKPDYKCIKREEYMEAIHKVYNRIGPFRPEDISKELTTMKKRMVPVITVRSTISRYSHENLLEETLDDEGFIRYYLPEESTPYSSSFQ